jgi:hypothetical protein
MASDPVPPKAKPKTWVHHKMSDDKALRILPGLRAGLTLHQVHEVPRRFQVYCDAHPEYAREARPLVAANAEAARLRRGDGLRTTTHCRAGRDINSSRSRSTAGVISDKRKCCLRRMFGKSNRRSYRPGIHVNHLVPFIDLQSL